MKTNKLFVLLALLSVGLLSACASRKAVYFTQSIRENVESYDITVDQIQFYNSHKIVLYRNLSYEETKVASGKIRFENGEFIDFHLQLLARTAYQNTLLLQRADQLQNTADIIDCCATNLLGAFHHNLRTDTVT